jgi:serine/threonine protein kinase
VAPLLANEVRHVISERNILRDMNSSFIVSFVGSFQDKHHLNIIMEYVIGGELFTQLSLRKRFNNEAAKFYAAEVVLFFEDIHSKNIVYRDLKPENILIDAMGHIKIVDFGFAKYLKKGHTFTFCGTPQYIGTSLIGRSSLQSLADRCVLCS